MGESVGDGPYMSNRISQRSSIEQWVYDEGSNRGTIGANDDLCYIG